MNIKDITLRNLEARLHVKRRESMTAQFGRDARSDWQVVVLVFIVLNVLSFVTNSLVYERINRGEIFLVPKREPVSARILDRAELREAAEFFAKKRETFERLRKTPPVIPGPGTLKE